jgi:cytochrome c peroxidase
MNEGTGKQARAGAQVLVELKLATLGCALGAAALASVGCQERDQSAQAAAELAKTAAPVATAAETESKKEFNPRLLRRFKPARPVIEAAPGENSQARIELGQMLYHEKRISKSKEVSCNSCHALDKYGVDGLKTSRGHDGKEGGRNAPTVYHAAGHFEQFWDGRAADVEAQALGPILNPIEMAAPNGEYVVNVLKAVPEYVAAFKKAFPGDKAPLTFENVGRAIGAFERQLTTRSRWDDYLEGNTKALSDKEVEGLKLFTNLGCMVCHTGEFLGGSMYEKVGTVEPWPNQQDQGRFAVTKRDGDRMMFKVPGLRNIAETAPYFHDGSVPTLEGAVSAMGKHQLGLDLAPDEVSAIAAWLKSLTGKLPEKYLQAPSLPVAGAAPARSRNGG